MKTFKDLKFGSRSNGFVGTQAVIEFDNDYGVSVITGVGAYSSEGKPYELAVMYEGEVTYDTDITSDVIGHLDESGVTSIMEKVQNLKP